MLHIEAQAVTCPRLHLVLPPGRDNGPPFLPADVAFDPATLPFTNLMAIRSCTDVSYGAVLPCILLSGACLTSTRWLHRPLLLLALTTDLRIR